MQKLLRQSQPLPLGMPAWAVTQYISRKDHKIHPSVLLGLEDNEMKSSLLDEYEDRQVTYFGF
jgi:hypothetical protein